ncbi:hypothetical protein [Brevundimonas sp.]|uniref:hypothetical protein n=1 Tax=Brevundimonas sp. TaxID=1871086 RepID=UPI002ABAA446|nr:hypothetical protein [Brevundimonas sp.]MDZ4364159.1 hypothetical protein [Brevundimonas sp.]
MTRRLIPLVALALLLTAFAPMIQGEPIPDREIILDEDYGLKLPGTTDRQGVVVLPVQPGRNYAILFPVFAQARYTAVARVEAGRMVVTSAPLAPGGRGPAYFMGRDGRRMTLTIPRGVERVRIILTEGPAPGPTPPR